MIGLLAHRGVWHEPGEKNSPAALRSSFERGFGVETDLRDSAGRLVVSHDPPTSDAPPASDLVDWAEGSGAPVAVNVKSDGISGALAELFAGRGIDWFAFDMSIPETVRYRAAGLPYLTRHSDVEPDPLLYREAVGVWLDAFHSDWFGPDDVRRHLDAGKRVALVSPELHGRDPERTWEWLVQLDAELGDARELMVCTDFPDRLLARLEDRS